MKTNGSKLSYEICFLFAILMMQRHWFFFFGFVYQLYKEKISIKAMVFFFFKSCKTLKVVIWDATFLEKHWDLKYGHLRGDLPWDWKIQRFDESCLIVLDNLIVGVKNFEILLSGLLVPSDLFIGELFLRFFKSDLVIVDDLPVDETFWDFLKIV